MMDSEYTDPRIIKTRRSIMQAFSELMREKPFKKISISNIAERALINRTTFYAHFESIEELLNSAMRQKFEQALTAWLPEHPKFTRENLHNLTEGIFNFLGGFIGQCPTSPGAPLALPLLQTQIQPAIYAILKEWLYESGLTEENSLDAQAGTISWAIFGGALRWSEGRDRTPIEVVVVHLVDSILIGAMATIE